MSSASALADSANPNSGQNSNQSSNQNSNQSSNQNSNQNSNSTTKVLTAGTVVHVELGNVRDILLDVRRAKTAASHLYGEVTRHPITSYNYVDAMGPVMMEIPMPTFDMSEVLPARKQWVDLYMAEITPALNYIKSDGDGIKASEPEMEFSDKVKERFDSLMQDCSASIAKATTCGSQLQNLTTAAPYDNLAIAKLTSEMHKDLGEVEKTTKHLIGEIKKSNKK